MSLSSSHSFFNLSTLSLPLFALLFLVQCTPFCVHPILSVEITLLVTRGLGQQLEGAAAAATAAAALWRAIRPQIESEVVLNRLICVTRFWNVLRP